LPASIARTWAQLARAPNLFSIPGDPLAGYLLAGGSLLSPRVAVAMAAALCIYAGGLFFNDYFDRDEDARDRPERPIPSGAVPPERVRAAGVYLHGAGIAISFMTGHLLAFLVATCLVLATLAYNGGAKRDPGFGPALMGGCRAGSVLLGAAFSASGWPPAVWIVAVHSLLFFGLLTWLAAGEIRDDRPFTRAWLLPLLPLAAAAALCLAQPPLTVASATVAFLFIGGATVSCAASVRAVLRQRSARPSFIGRVIRDFILVQTAWTAWAAPSNKLPIIIIVFIAFRISAARAAKHFYGS